MDYIDINYGGCNELQTGFIDVFIAGFIVNLHRWIGTRCCSSIFYLGDKMKTANIRNADLTFDHEFDMDAGMDLTPIKVIIKGINFYRNSPDNVLKIEYNHYEVYTDTNPRIEIDNKISEYIWGNQVEKVIDEILYVILYNNK